MSTFDIIVTIITAVGLIAMGLWFALALLKINKERDDED